MKGELRWKPRLSYSHGFDDNDRSEKYLAARVHNTYVARCQCNYERNRNISRHRAHAFQVPLKGVFCSCTTANSDESRACPTATGPTTMANRKSTWPQEYTTRMWLVVNATMNATTIYLDTERMHVKFHSKASSVSAQRRTPMKAVPVLQPRVRRRWQIGKAPGRKSTQHVCSSLSMQLWTQLQYI